MHPSRLVLASLLLTGLLAAAPPEGLPRFEEQTIDDTVEIGYGVAIGDVDGDGAADILLVDKREIAWFRNPGWEKSVIAKNLTLRDNVCIAAEDIDGDGQVNIAVGAQWNPGETADKAQSGAVFYLQAPPTSKSPWTPVPLPHDPTTHRMRWMQTDAGPALVVVPLHGIGNRDGAGENTVNVRLHRVDPAGVGDAAAWTDEVLGAKLHVTHNLDIRDGFLYIAGAEGIVKERPGGESVLLVSPENSTPPTRGAGEIAVGRDFIATVEPFHGTDLAVYRENGGQWTRTLLTDTLNQGHALGVADFNGDGRDDVVVGWRNPDAEGHVGVKLFYQKEDGSWYPPFWIARDLVAAEDLKIADLNQDGRPDLVVSGRSSKNLVIFWNRK